MTKKHKLIQSLLQKVRHLEEYNVNGTFYRKILIVVLVSCYSNGVLFYIHHIR